MKWIYVPGDFGIISKSSEIALYTESLLGCIGLTLNSDKAIYLAHILDRTQQDFSQLSQGIRIAKDLFENYSSSKVIKATIHNRISGMTKKINPEYLPMQQKVEEILNDLGIQDVGKVGEESGKCMISFDKTGDNFSNIPGSESKLEVLKKDELTSRDFSDFYDIQEVEGHFFVGKFYQEGDFHQVYQKELIKMFYEAKKLDENLLVFRKDVQEAAQKIVDTLSMPSDINKDQYDTAKSNALNLLYNVNLNNTRKSYISYFKKIYNDASLEVKNNFKINYNSIIKYK